MTNIIIKIITDKNKLKTWIEDWNARYLAGENSEKLIHDASKIISNINIYE